MVHLPGTTITGETLPSSAVTGLASDGLVGRLATLALRRPVPKTTAS